MSYRGLLNLKDILSANICQWLCLLHTLVYFSQIHPSEVTAIVVLSSYRLWVSWHAYKEKSSISWRLQHLVFPTGAAEVNKPYCSVNEVTQKKCNLSGVEAAEIVSEAAQEFSPRLYMLLSIWWMETRRLTLWRSLEGGHMGCAHPQETLGAWFGLSSGLAWDSGHLLFFFWAVESCLSEGHLIESLLVLLNQVRMAVKETLFKIQESVEKFLLDRS